MSCGQPKDENGKPKVDKNNPDPKLRARPTLGLILVRDFVWDEDDNEWDDGYIYDPESGDEYSCYMTLLDKNTLKVRGYIGFSMIGKTQLWKRVD